ncbi:MAG: hypothetical protein HY801_13150 [Candidatus Lindowbacteria bacterium]|nr:hypothetical protein [Candidatus Lindowbacteria bacterium]
MSRVEYKPANTPNSVLPPIWVVAALTALYLAVSPFSIRDIGGSSLLDADYGVLTHTHARMLEGDMLYKDIYVAYPPAASYLISSLYCFFGDNLRTLRIALAIVGAATACLVFSLSRALTSTGYAAAVAGLAFFLGPSLYDRS